MKYTEKLLKKELKEWKRELIESNRFYEKGKRFPSSYKKNIKKINEIIEDLEKALVILKSWK